LNKKLKIVFLFPSFPNKAEAYRIDQILSLKKSGHEVINLSIKKPYSPNQEPEHKNLLKNTIYLDEYSPILKKVLKIFLSIIKLFFNDFKSFLKIIFIIFAGKNRVSFGRIQLISIILNIKPNLIHAHFGHAGTYLTNIKDHLNIPIIVSFYGWDYSQDLKLRENDYKRMFKKIDGITAMNEFMKNRLIKFGCPREKIRIVKIWVDNTLLSGHDVLNPNKDKVNILSIGRLTHKKGYDLCLTLMKELKQENILFEYNIIGEGPLENKLKELCKIYSLEKYVKFIGSINRSEIGQYLTKCDIFLIHSVTGPDGDLEGTPTVILEAGLLQKPVISTFHAGIPEIIDNGKSGFLTQENDINQTKQYMIKLINDRSKRISFGKNLKSKIIKEYTEEVNSKRFLDFYHYLTKFSVD